jgi:hypothetical protein
VSRQWLVRPRSGRKFFGSDIVAQAAEAPRITGATRLFVPFRAQNDRNCQAVPIDIPVNRRAPTGADAATAGFVLIAAMLACAAIGFGLGSLLGVAVPLGLLGLFAGLVVGFVLVYARYRRI